MATKSRKAAGQITYTECRSCGEAFEVPRGSSQCTKCSAAAELEWLSESYSAERRSDVLRSIGRIAQRLHEAAADIERMVEREQTSPVSRLVERVQHDVLWMVANLGLDRLTGELLEVEAAERTERGVREKLVLAHLGVVE
jgi:hypothetical protein